MRWRWVRRALEMMTEAAEGYRDAPCRAVRRLPSRWSNRLFSSRRPWRVVVRYRPQREAVAAIGRNRQTTREERRKELRQEFKKENATERVRERDSVLAVCVFVSLSVDKKGEEKGKREKGKKG